MLFTKAPKKMLSKNQIISFYCWFFFPLMGMAFRTLKWFFLIFLLILSLELLCIDLSDILTFN